MRLARAPAGATAAVCDDIANLLYLDDATHGWLGCRVADPARRCGIRACLALRHRLRGLEPRVGGVRPPCRPARDARRRRCSSVEWVRGSRSDRAGGGLFRDRARSTTGDPYYTPIFRRYADGEVRRVDLVGLPGCGSGRGDDAALAAHRAVESVGDVLVLLARVHDALHAAPTSSPAPRSGRPPGSAPVPSPCSREQLSPLLLVALASAGQDEHQQVEPLRSVGVVAGPDHGLVDQQPCVWGAAARIVRRIRAASSSGQSWRIPERR